MNYLAHAYLSFDVPEVLAGNMISDFVKGARRYDYPPAIGLGIELHRRIDSFTDAHPVTAEARRLFREAAGKYAGCFVDIAYDYFLARDTTEFPPGALAAFAGRTYAQLADFAPYFPGRFPLFFAHMRRENWLLHYGDPEGIRNSFLGLGRRAKWLGDTAPAFAAFEKEQETLGRLYAAFFPDLKTFARRELDALLAEAGRQALPLRLIPKSTP